MAADVEMIVASDVATRRAVYRFRQQVAGMGAAVIDLLPHAYHVSGADGLQDLLDPMAIVAAAIDTTSQQIVGAARANYVRDGALPFYPDLYGLRELGAAQWMSSSVTSGWAMAPAYGGRSGAALTHPATRLAWTLFDIALRERICHDFLDCQDTDVAFFTRLGYRHVREVQRPEGGRSNLMRLDVYDWTHLAAVQSPFLQFARGVLS